MADDRKPAARLRTLTFRAVVIGIVSMVALMIWVHFHEVLLPQPNVLAENSPPAGAVGIFIGVILVGAAVTALRPRLRLTPPELLVVYAMLVTSAPLMSQGMWHRFLGFVVAIPHNKHNLNLVDSYSEKLWPHGEHLVANRRFGEWPADGMEVTPPDRARTVRAESSPIGAADAIELFNPDPDEARAQTTLRIRVPRRWGGRERLVPGERYYFNALFRLQDFQPSTRFTADLVSDGGSFVSLVSMTRSTEAAFANPGGFTRRGEPYVSIPYDLGEAVELVFLLEGPGRAAITDVVFFSNEALARLHKGSTEVRASDLERLPENARDSLVVRPDNLASPAGVWYALKGYVPYRQWITPLIYWCSIVMALFVCLLAIGVIFRKQWAEHERFAFPMVVLPRLLLEQRDEGGRLVRPLFRSQAFRAGVILALVYCLLQGLAFHVPGMPDPVIRVNLVEYPSSPALKAFFQGMAGGTLYVVLLYTAIAFFVDLDMLLSILVCFWLAKLPYYFGEVFGWKNLRGPVANFPFPHEQHIGAFLGLALIVLWISRKHLLAVVRRALGLRGGADDSAEAMRYRTALLLVVLSFAFFAVWGWLTGLGAGSALLFFGFLVVCGLSASRIRTECGAPGTYFTPYFPYLIFFLLGGLHFFGARTMVLAYCAGGFMAVAQFLLFAPTQVEMLHLGEQYQAKPQAVSWALILGGLGGVLLGGYVMLVWAYGVGGENITYMKTWAIRQDWYLNSLRGALAEADAQVLAAASRGAAAAGDYPVGPMTAVASGTAITVLLTALRMHFVRFWLHPIGYVLANTYFIHGAWGSLLAAWVVKALALKIGGPRVIRERLTPFFAGVFCGCVLGMALWDVVAVVQMAGGSQNVFTCFP